MRKTDNGMIGARLRAARLRAGLTQAEFAEKVGSSRRRVVAWEQGENYPPALVLAQLRVACGVSPEWVLAGPGSVPLEYVAADDLCRVTRIERMIANSARHIGLTLTVDAVEDLAALVIKDAPEAETEVEVQAVDRVLAMIKAVAR